MDNIEDLTQVTQQQTMIIDELKVIEDELDRYMDGQAGPNNKFLKQIFSSSVPQSSEAPDRERVFTQALQLEDEIKKMREDISDVSGALKQNEAAQKSASDKYIFEGESDIQRRNVSKISDQLTHANHHLQCL